MAYTDVYDSASTAGCLFVSSILSVGLCSPKHRWAPVTCQQCRSDSLPDVQGVNLN